MRDLEVDSRQLKIKTRILGVWAHQKFNGGGGVVTLVDGVAFIREFGQKRTQRRWCCWRECPDNLVKRLADVGSGETINGFFGLFPLNTTMTRIDRLECLAQHRPANADFG